MRNLDDYAIQCMEELDAISIEYGNIIEVVANTRAKKRWGQCKAIPGGYSININAILLDERNDEQGLKETIIHELLHSCKDCMNHGSKWNYLAQKVNSAYGYNIKRINSAAEKGVSEETRPYMEKYTVKCNKCGYIYTRARKTKLIQYPEHYRCGCCGGSLSLIK